MRRPLVCVALLAACGGSAPPQGAVEAAAPSPAVVRAERRTYDGAPPTVPHPDPGAECAACHDGDGQATGAAFAPPSPHVGTSEEAATRRCRQCHVFVATDGTFVDSRFVGLPQNLRRGGRATPGAPPTIPHRLQMRTNCVACHAGPGAREEVRTPHPERTRCRQCHVPVADTTTFSPTPASGEEGRP